VPNFQAATNLPIHPYSQGIAVLSEKKMLHRLLYLHIKSKLPHLVTMAFAITAKAVMLDDCIHDLMR